jgi:hypothetical protein
MFAQVIQGGTATETRGELNDFVREVLVPALQDEPGFAGTLSLFDRRGDGMMIMLWDTQEQAELPTDKRCAALQKALSGMSALSTRSDAPATIWEVGAKVVHTGSSRRLTGEPAL